MFTVIVKYLSSLKKLFLHLCEVNENKRLFGIFFYKHCKRLLHVCLCASFYRVADALFPNSLQIELNKIFFKCQA